MPQKTLNPPLQKSEIFTAKSPFLPLLFWLSIQMLAFAFCAMRVPFYALKSFPFPGEQLALPVMLFVQITSASLLFPYLMRDFRCAMLVNAAGWPFTMLAAHLGGHSVPFLMAMTILYVGGWNFGLYTLAAAFPSPRGRGISIFAATFLACATVLVRFLKADYGRSEGTWINTHPNFNATFGAWTVATGEPLSKRAWLPVILVVGTGFAALIIRTAFRWWMPRQPVRQNHIKESD